MDPDPPPPRRRVVLLLHGYRQHAALFARKVEPLVRALMRAGHTVVPLDGPMVVEAEDASGGPALRGWFALDRATILDAVPYAGFDAACAAVRDAAARHGATAAVGFSQGATLAAWCAERGWLEAVVAFSPYPVADPALAPDPALATHPAAAATPGACFVVCGERDTLVPPAASLRVRADRVLRHGGGHVVPTTVTLRHAVLDFLGSR